MRLTQADLSAVLRSSVKWCSLALDLPRRRAAGIVILIYHRTGARTGGEADLPSALFSQQMEVLAASGRAVSLDVALRTLECQPAADAPDPVVVTFDDGTPDVADVAMPILQQFQIPATVYLATDFIERSRPFPADGRPLSWSAARDLVSTGLVTIGSHTHTHPRLDRLERPRVATELDRSIALIEERLGHRPEHFATPTAFGRQVTASVPCASESNRQHSAGPARTSMQGRICIAFSAAPSWPAMA